MSSWPYLLVLTQEKQSYAKSGKATVLVDNKKAMNNDCKLIIKNFKFLEEAGFKCTVKVRTVLCRLPMYECKN